MSGHERNVLIGNYRVLDWNMIGPTGHNRWSVSHVRTEGALGEIISKHKTKADAVAAAKRYVVADKRRSA